MQATNKPSLKDIEKLPKLEKLIMEYFLKYISAGEIITIIDLRETIKSMRDPELVPEFDDVIIEISLTRAIARLVKEGFLEHTEGCYNLAPHLREELKKTGKYKPSLSRTLF
ncbi:MAG: hypothetical protein J7K21_01150 [Desulfurococcales archaeon]|nr:hypothetical protein [Desulfurococcales archaeon]